ncbi:uncharacterized protein LOC129568805 isoform X2 [Sitodiplosis mosellana]|uniref:uncharacterized protein LOC129568805 isoform X2 n=1 Tax=Sitodiplosis mosellana TaxID=263140 RepID=UPI002444FA43|nr:uncharacterized protein LOC129568805 isoform X2 [Sitodiplosis mosellana]
MPRCQEDDQHTINTRRLHTPQVMSDFDRESFLGRWYEIERYFAVSELASRCVSVTYERRADGKIYVSNEMTNRFTNVQRIVSGVINQTAKSDEASFTVKYTGLPVNYDTTLHILDTDYDSFAVVWSCNALAGPVGHTESVWILARQRIPDEQELQTAYGVLDKFKISRTFFVKTDQTNCEKEGEPIDTGYDSVAEDEVEVNNQYGHENPQIHQVQHIAHVENLQQFSPAYPVQPIYRPHIHNHGQPVYFKQNDVPTEKSAGNTVETENKITETKTIETKTEQGEKITKTEQPAKIEKTELAEKSDTIESSTKLPASIIEILGVNPTAKI